MSSSDKDNSAIVFNLSELPPSAQSILAVGGKALKAFELSTIVHVPRGFVVLARAYEQHVEPFQADIAAVIAGDKSKLAAIRDQIVAALLDEAVVRGITEQWTDGRPVSVRSSGTSEDLSMSSFAGMYETYLNQRSLDDVLASVKKCWASMWADHVLAGYAKFESAPSMAVLIMEQIDSAASGVIFTRNPLSDDGTGGVNEYVIESVLGQGTGLVSGDITPDRFVIDRQSGEIKQSIVSKQTKRIDLRGDGESGTLEVDVPEPAASAPSIKEEQVKALMDMAQRIVAHFKAGAQDIEWAVGADGTFYALQARAVVPSAEEEEKVLSRDPWAFGRRPVFQAPGPGTFEQDSTHFPRPMPKIIEDERCAFYNKGFGEGFTRTGCLVRGLEIWVINGFGYNKVIPCLPTDEDMPQRFETAAKFWAQNAPVTWYENDFLKDEKPKWIKEALAVQNVDLAAMSDDELVAHFHKAVDLANQGAYRHHIFTATAMIGMGDTVARVCQWAGVPPSDALSLFQGMAKESGGIYVPDGLAPQLRSCDAARQALEQDDVTVEAVRAALGDKTELIDDFVTINKCRNSVGYTARWPTLGETTALIDRLREIIQHDPADVAAAAKAKHESAVAELRAKVPEEHQAEFDAAIHQGLICNRWRDERGLYSDLWSSGILRTVWLELGRRIVAKTDGALASPDLITEATRAETVALMEGKADDAAALAQELADRRAFALSHSSSEVPSYLGDPPQPPPPMDGLPPFMVRTMTAVGLSITNVFGSKDYRPVKKNTLTGEAASRGVAEGVVRVVNSPDMIATVKGGDIVVTPCTSAAFNSVLPLARAIVTEFGGILSHAAIVSREKGIPCVVSVREVTHKLETGMKVRVNGSAGTVEILAQD